MWQILPDTQILILYFLIVYIHQELNSLNSLYEPWQHRSKALPFQKINLWMTTPPVLEASLPVLHVLQKMQHCQAGRAFLGLPEADLSIPPKTLHEGKKMH